MKHAWWAKCHCGNHDKCELSSDTKVKVKWWMCFCFCLFVCLLVFWIWSSYFKVSLSIRILFLKSSQWMQVRMSKSRLKTKQTNKHTNKSNKQTNKQIKACAESCCLEDK